MAWVPYVMAGISLLKSQQDAQKASAERKRQAEMTRYSPWTGMHGESVQDPNMIADVAQGALSGAAYSQNMKNYDQQQKMADAYMKSMSGGGGGSSWGGMTGMNVPNVQLKSPWLGQ